MLNKETILYAVIGILTTVINIFSFWVLNEWQIGLLVTNTIAFIIAVLFAYWGNCVVVFDKKTTKKSFTMFWLMRLLTLAFDNSGMVIFVDLGIDELVSKCIINLIIIIFNYVCSKYYIFKDRVDKELGQE